MVNIKGGVVEIKPEKVTKYLIRHIPYHIALEKYVMANKV